MDQDTTKPSAPAWGEIAALAAELGELSRRAPARLAARVAALTIREQADLALRLPARERLELLLHAPKPMRLVRALPDSEFYLTVRDLDPTDTLPLLALSSADQIRHLLDLESWRKDRFDARRTGAWVAVLLEAGEPTLGRFLSSIDDELLALLFQRWARVTQVDPEDGPEIQHAHSETGDERGIVSPDGNYRFSPIIPEHMPAVGQIARIFYLAQPERYRQVLWSAVQELPAELEEQALRWRLSRLEEHGFPPWEEALSVYAPPEGARAHPQPLPPTDPDGLAVPRAPLRALAARDLLAQAIEPLPDASRERVLHEIVSVGNRLLLADHADTGDPAAHRRALGVAMGYVAIALEARGITEPADLARAVEGLPLLELFREGFSRASRLQQTAHRWTRTGWPSVHPKALDLLDAPFRDRVVALLERRPLYLVLPSDQAPGDLRPFRSMAEIEETRVALELVQTIGGLLVDRLGVNIERLVHASELLNVDPPRLSSVLLTCVAWHAVRSELRCDPLPPDVARDFLHRVASRRAAPVTAPPDALAAWVAACAGAFELEPLEVARIERFGAACLERLGEECGSLDPGSAPDPRFVSCLLLSPESRT